MKQRVLTGLIIILILVPIFLSKIIFDIDHYIFIVGFILAVVAINEMISMKETEKSLPFMIHLLAYLSVIYISFFDAFSLPEKYNFNILPYVVIFLFTSMVLSRRFKFLDATFMLFAIFYIGLTFQSLVHFFLKTNGIYELIYIILIAMFTDTFAYFTGTFYGKHKLCPNMSPKKTIEGALGGTIIATILAAIYVVYSGKLTLLFDNSLIYIIILTLVLSISSQIGDLGASVVKRQYKIKDYGNLFPGHGGVLDRLDSILFTSLAYFYITELLAKLW